MLRRCWQCDHQQEEALRCSTCGAVQELSADADLFSVVGLAPSLSIDRKALESRFYELSRQVHPDRFGTAAPRAQAASLAATALLNRAYRTLRDPVARGRYWLERHGEPLADAQRRVPKELAALVFEIQERLEGFSADDGSAREALRADLRRVGERRDACLARLDSAYADSPRSSVPLETLREMLAEIAYLSTLARNIESALAC